MSWRSSFRRPRFHAPQAPRLRISWSPASMRHRLVRGLIYLGTFAFFLAAALFEWRVINSANGIGGGGGAATIVVNSVPTILLAVLLGAGWWMRWRGRAGLGALIALAAAALMSLMLLF